MLMEDLFLKFQGISPSDVTGSYLNEKMRVLQDEAPYGATLEATFAREGALFRGVLTVYSSAGKFFASASGKRLEEVAQKLIEQIRWQLNRWKAERFQQERSKNNSAIGKAKSGGGYEAGHVA